MSKHNGIRGVMACAAAIHIRFDLVVPWVAATACSYEQRMWLLVVCQGEKRCAAFQIGGCVILRLRGHTNACGYVTQAEDAASSSIA